MNLRWLKWAARHYLLVLPQAYYAGVKIWRWKRTGQWDERVR